MTVSCFFSAIPPTTQKQTSSVDLITGICIGVVGLIVVFLTVTWIMYKKHVKK